ncbi:MAG TPA: hypothetical protein VL101_04885 [Nordella sp.]|nr:hypothetical protein [Nordella sp.]
MIGRLFGRLALAGLAAIILLQPQNAYADYKKVGPDSRSGAQIAEDECATQAQGSGKVIAGTIIAGVIGMMVARDSYIKDCMKARGYERVASKKPAKGKKTANKNTRNNFNDGNNRPPGKRN